MSLKFVFYRNDQPREHRIALELSLGAKKHGIDFEIRPKADFGPGRKYQGPDGADLYMAYGVKSRDLLRAHHFAGTNWAIVDKGYVRQRGPHGVEMWTRISVNETYPLNALKKAKLSDERWRKIGVRLLPRHTRNDGYILLAGSSQKFYDYFGLGDEARLHAKIIRRIRNFTNRPVMFRPKPSYSKRHQDSQDVSQLYGADYFSHPDEKDGIQKALSGAHCLVTFASNSACDAIFRGIPAIVLGPHITDTVADHLLSNIEAPLFPKDSLRQQWAANLAWEQWTLSEMRAGDVWAHLLPRIEQGPRLDDVWYDVGTDPRFAIAVGDKE